MQTFRKSLAGLAIALGMVVGSATPAAAATTVFTFTGECAPADCNGTGVGTLVLQNFTPGVQDFSNFVSFSYESNLLSFSAARAPINPFQVPGAPLPYPHFPVFSADFSGLPGSASVTIGIDFSDNSFAVFRSGVTPDGPAWSVFQGTGSGGAAGSLNADNDHGAKFTWTQVPGELLPGAPVPEPLTWFLMIGGLGLAGTQLRAIRKQTLA